MKHVILGNGPAGVLAAEIIRRHRPADEILLIGHEPEPPYSRMAIPYLLMGDIREEGAYLRKDANHFERLRIALRTASATSVDTAARRVHLGDGSAVPFDRLLIATGAKPIKPAIAGIDLPGVHPCWTMADAREIMKLARPRARVLQMGAGFIGCIILEALAARAVDLTVVEMGDRMVPRMMDDGAGGMIKRWVEMKGVRVHTSTRVQAIERGAPLAVRLSNGESLAADLVIVATGVQPNIAFLQGSGIDCGVGVLTDAHMQTSVPGIYAAG
ncbi:MAG TPA: FAD-dependent oxidoreductase, partial [Casimicrobiaceae bacterium]|nr:FAD-dependent oxidoreductase [Casimicrobiaceae bacterium]